MKPFLADEEFAPKGAWLRSRDGVSNFGTPFLMVKVRNCVFGTTYISHRMTDYLESLVSEMTYNVSMGTLNPTHSLIHSIAPKVGVVTSRDLILQYNVKVDNKTANINVKNLSV